MLQSKKIIMSLVGLIMAVLAQSGIITFNEATQDAITLAIIAIIGSFNVGQGIADGLSGGITSSALNAEFKGQEDDE